VEEGIDVTTGSIGLQRTFKGGAMEDDGFIRPSRIDFSELWQ